MMYRGRRGGGHSYNTLLINREFIPATFKIIHISKYYNFSNRISTRRFLALFNSVSFDTTGLSGP